MRGPIPYFGGKQRLADWIISHFPDHKVCVEVFGGGAAVLFAKKPSPVEIYNDIDSGLVGFFRVLRDKEKAAELKRLLELTPYSREEFYAYRKTWVEQTDELERVRQWYVLATQGFSGKFGVPWCFSVKGSSSGKAISVAQWQSRIAIIESAANRFGFCQVENLDFKELIGKYDDPETLFYLDPPYVKSTRLGGGYVNEMDDKDHMNLVHILLDIKGKAIISGYDSSLYSPLADAGWSAASIDVSCMAAGTTRASGMQGAGNKAHLRRTETLWISPNCQLKKQLSMF